MPEFFVPGAQSPEDAKRLYGELRAYVDANHWGPLDDEEESGYNFRLTHVDQTKHVYQVGEVNIENGLVVDAIFEAHGPHFYICSRKDGAIVVQDVTLGTDDVVYIEVFGPD